MKRIVMCLLVLAVPASSFAQSPIQQMKACQTSKQALENRVAELEKENASLRTKLAEAPVPNAKDSVQEKAPGQAPVTFGKTKWGMSKKQVRKLYPKAKKDTPSSLILESHKISGLQGGVLFQFHKDQLVHVVWILLEKHTNQNEYIEDYKKMAALLTKKYGKPDRDVVDWSNDLFADNPNRHGMAIGLGHLAMKVEWDRGETQVNAGILGDNTKITTIMTWTHKRLSQERDDALEAEELEGL